MTVYNRYHRDAPPGAVDIMRGSFWGNPYKIGLHGSRDEVVALYRTMLWLKIRHEPGYAQRVQALAGRDLVCCCAPLPCHGDVLARAAQWLRDTYPGGVPDLRPAWQERVAAARRREGLDS